MSRPYTLLEGDVRQRLAELPDNSVHCIVTSPPYLGLRDYGVEGQIGQEPSWKEHIAVLAGVFEEDLVKRMDRLGFWCEERTRFLPEQDFIFRCGFTPHGTTGWNGKPDFLTSAATRPMARALSALACIEAQEICWICGGPPAMKTADGMHILCKKCGSEAAVSG